MLLQLNEFHMLARGIGICGLCVSRDYVGASNVGIKALLVRRPGVEGEGEHKEPGEDLTGVSVVRDLSEVVDEVLKSRSDAQNFQASADDVVGAEATESNADEWSIVCSWSWTTSSIFSPSLSIVQRITRGSFRRSVCKPLSVFGDASKCMNQ